MTPSTVALIGALLKNLPLILSILKRIGKMAADGQTDKKITATLKDIDKAFEDGDEEALRRALNS